MRKNSIWRDKAEKVSFPALQGSVEVEAAIVGAGISGLTAALQLASAGIRVAVVESFEVGSGTTGLSSCHLTTDADQEYRNIKSDFDEETASVVAGSRKEAIDFIERTIDELEISCDFRRLPGYLYTELSEQVQELQEELAAAAKAGLDVKMVESAPLPFKVKKAVRFEDQAEFNAQQYLTGLAESVIKQGGIIFENSPVVSMEEKDGVYTIKTSQGILTAKHVFVATQLPLFFNILQTVSSPYISYLLAAKLKGTEYPVGLFWDMADPYHYIRYYETNEGAYVIVGGEDHKTGKEVDTKERMAALEKYVLDRFDVLSIDYKWSAQYYEPADGLPYIGRSPFSANAYVATGFSGDGLVYGTIAGLIVSDLIAGKKNPWLKVYDSTRFTPAASATDFIKENAGNAMHFIKDRLVTDTDMVSEVHPGEGKIVKIDGEKVAVSRDENYNLHAVSPVCTHMKCIVHWNNFEKTWDCPCHGSRFSMDGEVIYGPAVSALQKKEIKMSKENDHKG